MMTRATNTGTLKKEGKEEKRLLLQRSKCSSAWRNGDKSSKQPYIGLKLMPPVGEMMCEPMPRQFSGSRTCMGPK
jgi:hypothetical protein